MDEGVACMTLRALGFQVTNGYVTFGAYRYGRLTTRRFKPEGGEGVPLEEIDTFSGVDEGCGGRALVLRRRDGREVRLGRVPLPDKVAGACFQRNKEGELLMPHSISDVREVWFAVFPDFAEQCWFEETTGSVMILPEAYGGSGAAEQYDDAANIALTCRLQDRLKGMGCRGIQPSKETVFDVVRELARGNRRNRFREMMGGEWDGVERLSTVFTDVFGGVAAGLSEEESRRLLTELCRRWFVGAVARQYRADVQMDFVPIIVGGQGIRKTSAVRWMACEPGFAIEISSFDERLFVEQSKGHLVGEISELRGLKRTDAEHLKMMLSKTSDTVRLPYDRAPTQFPRRIALIGTTNEAEFNTDPTGARRFFPFRADPSRCRVRFGEEGFRSEEARGYIRQVWYEANRAYLSGEGWDLDPVVLELAARPQSAATVTDPLVELLGSLVDENHPDVGDCVCMSDLVHHLETVPGATPDMRKTAAKTWWVTPNPEWGESRTVRIRREDGREWLPSESVTAKAKTRVLPPGGRVERCGLLGV